MRLAKNEISIAVITHQPLSHTTAFWYSFITKNISSPARALLTSRDNHQNEIIIGEYRVKHTVGIKFAKI